MPLPHLKSKNLTAKHPMKLYKLLPYALQTSKRIKCSKVQDVLHNCGQNAKKIPVRQRARDIDHCGRLSDAIRAQAAALKKSCNYY